MPLSHYNAAFGGERGAARKAMSSMRETYGPQRGESVFYATANSRGGTRAPRRAGRTGGSRGSARGGSR